MSASVQTITQGQSDITSAGAYNTPASGRAYDVWGAKRIMTWTITGVTFGTNGLIKFDPRAQGFDKTPVAVWGYYQPAGSSDHFYIIANWDPVNLNLQCWDLTDNDAGGTDTASGQFIVFAMSQ